MKSVIVIVLQLTAYIGGILIILGAGLNMFPRTLLVNFMVAFIAVLFTVGGIAIIMDDWHPLKRLTRRKHGYRIK